MIAVMSISLQRVHARNPQPFCYGRKEWLQGKCNISPSFCSPLDFKSLHLAEHAETACR